MAAAVEQTLIFTYGTLKRGFPNHRLLLSISAALVSGRCSTSLPHPLVVGPNGVPFLLPLPGRGRRVSGEIYSLSSANALAAVDDLEGVGAGHYERMPIKVISEEGRQEEEREVMAYFAHKSYAGRMWRRCGEEAGAIGEYTAADAAAFVPAAEWRSGATILGEVERFLNGE